MLICANCGTENPVGSRFCNGCGAPLEAAAPAAETRKTVTILFIDATSSTALGERLDPESMRALMTRYFDVMREVIELHGGSVEKFIGDAVMAVFGVPVVHEDDALRACRSAVAIQDRLRDLEAEIRAEQGVTIEWRMGINTGEVVAGDGASGQRMVTGDAVNVAARLEAAASPGEILIGAETHALVRESVTDEAVEPLALKGKAGAVSAWRLRSVGEARDRRARPMEAPLVGRRRPLRLLEEAFREVVEDRVCHLFTVLGVAGVGKSRLIDEFIAVLGDQAQLATGRCLAYGAGITYWPVVEAIRHGLGLAEDADRATVEAKLGEVLVEATERERVEAVIGHLMGFVDEPPASSEIFWGVRRIFEAISRQHPLVVVFDDIHWGEPTFLDLVDHISDWTRDAPILLVAMARPELLEKRPAWGGGKRSATTVQLEPLSDTESDELVVALLGRADLPEAVTTQIAHAAEGNPLFVEELLGKLIDDGFLVRTDAGWAAVGDLHQLVIPPTIQALMAARLDSLGRDERTVIERASVEGKTFHRGAVTALAPDLIESVVSDRLATLTRMELLRPDQSSFVGEEAYQFRHLLIRDAAYQALAKQTRAELHERFAAWLERAAADRITEYEEILGYHYEQAYRYRLELGPADDHARELAERAGSRLIAAALRAAAREDIAAALTLLGRLTELLPAASAERRMAQARLGPLWLQAGDGGRAISILEESRELARAAGDDRTAAWAAIGLMEVESSTASLSGAETGERAEALRLEFIRLGDQDGADQARLLVAMTLFAQGRAAECAELAQSVADRPGATHASQLEAVRWTGIGSVYGPLPTSETIALIRQRAVGGIPGSHLGIGRMLALQGHYPEARAEIDLAEARLRDLGDRMSLSVVSEVRGLIAYQEEDFSAALSHLRRSYDDKVGMGDKGYASTTAVNVADSLIQLGRWDEAEGFARIAMDTSAADDTSSQAGGRAMLAQVLAERGEQATAERLAREAVAIMEATDYLDFHAWLLIALAKVLRRGGADAESVQALRQAEGLLRQKEATAHVEQVERLLAEWGEG